MNRLYTQLIASVKFVVAALQEESEETRDSRCSDEQTYAGEDLHLENVEHMVFICLERFALHLIFVQQPEKILFRLEEIFPVSFLYFIIHKIYIAGQFYFRVDFYVCRV